MRDRVLAVLTGGIGSGKSAAGAHLAGLGAHVLSADLAARAAIAPGGPAHDAVASRWPRAVGADGQIDRAALASIVFADHTQLRELEAITHPVVAESIAASVAATPDGVVIVEVPLLRDLFGPGWVRIVVDAPVAVRVRRLVERGMDPDDVARRIAAQPTREEWLAAAELVIDNSGTPDVLEAECRRVWDVLASGGPVTRRR